MMATSRPVLRAASRTMAARSMWSCAVPWLKFSRTTLTLAQDHLLQQLGRVGRRAERGNDLGGVAGNAIRAHEAVVSVLYSLLYTLCVY
jgi:hypothetical protein